MAKKSNNKGSTETSAAPKRWRRYLWRTGLKLALVGVLLFAAYGVYLDSLIKAKFEGERWELPALVYARPLTLNPGMPLRQQELQRELELLHYHQVSQLSQPGQYRVVSNKIELHARAFDYPDGSLASGRIAVAFDNDHLAAVYRKGRAVEQARLEPVLLERMQTSLNEDRILVDIDAVPKALVEALLLVEDRDFYQHFGVSPLSIARALLVNLKAGRTVQGGSTLTQQLAKNFFLTRERTLWRKAQEAYMALLLEWRYDKDEILEAYLNEIYLGQNYATAVHGMGLGSRFYFGRNLAELGPEQLATLVALVKGPSYYDPWRHPQRLLERRDMVLRLMLEHGLLSSDDYQLAASRPLNVQSREQAELNNKPAITTVLRREMLQFAPQLAQQNGLKIFTSIDPLAQKAAEQAVMEGVKRLEPRAGSSLQGALVVLDPYRGEIRALVGDKRPGFAGFNRALDAKRPIGSLMKPVVYLTALAQESYHLGSMLADRPVSMVNKRGERWQPQNYDKRFRGSVPLIDALTLSLNVPTVNLGMSVGLSKVADTYAALSGQEGTRFYPSSLLGAVSLSPLEVAQMYAPLADHGRYRDVGVLRYLVSAEGEVLAEVNRSYKQVATPQSVYLLNHALHQVTVDGTAKALQRHYPDAVMAGKTGTSNDTRDAWYAGFDGRDVVVSWVGRDDNGETGLTGSSGALPLYDAFVANRGYQNLDLTPPAGITTAYFDKQDGSLVAANCGDGTAYPALASQVKQVSGCGKGDTGPSWWDRLFGG